MTKDHLPWLALKHIKGIGNYTFKRLIDAFKTPENVFSANIPDLLKIQGITKNIAVLIKNNKISDSIKKDLDTVFKKKINILTLSCKEYPELLKQLPDPPPLLYVYGKLDQTPKISVVGSRKSTEYGKKSAYGLSQRLAESGFIVVSGMALGIDTAAHTGALDGKGKTIAVLGSGLGIVYPPENFKLFHNIAESGCVISEFPVMTQPTPHNFPMRNRIICGLSLGTLVVEATEKSGSLITARLANEQGREVFAVPGSIQSSRSSGTHKLLKQGAKLVENVNDIFDEIENLIVYEKKDKNQIIPTDLTKPALNNKNYDSELDPDEKIVISILEHYPVHIDTLSRKLSMKPGMLSGILLNLELKDMVSREAGNMFFLNT